MFNCELYESKKKFEFFYIVLAWAEETQNYNKLVSEEKKSCDRWAEKCVFVGCFSYSCVCLPSRTKSAENWMSESVPVAWTELPTWTKPENKSKTRERKKKKKNTIQIVCINNKQRLWHWLVLVLWMKIIHYKLFGAI